MYVDPSGHEPNNPCSLVLDDQCVGNRTKVSPFRQPDLTKWGKKMEELFNEYQKPENFGPEFTVTDFLEFILAAEFNAVNIDDPGNDIPHAAVHWFYTVCAYNTKGGQCSGFSEKAAFNWIGAMESGRRRYNTWKDSGDLDKIGGTGLDIAEKIVDAILHPPTNEWKRHEGNYWGGKWDPVNHHPFTWGNGSLWTISPANYIIMMPGATPLDHWYLLTYYQTKALEVFRVR